MNGAQPTDTARAILRFKGVYYRKHLAVGVAKGAITQEDADKRYLAWVEAKEGRIAARAAKTAEEKAAFYAMVSGQPKPSCTGACRRGACSRGCRRSNRSGRRSC